MKSPRISRPRKTKAQQQKARQSPAQLGQTFYRFEIKMDNTGIHPIAETWYVKKVGKSWTYLWRWDQETMTRNDQGQPIWVDDKKIPAYARKRIPISSHPEQHDFYRTQQDAISVALKRMQRYGQIIAAHVKALKAQQRRGKKKPFRKCIHSNGQ